MKPIKTSRTNAIFELPGGTEENDLPVERNTDSNGRNIITSTWEFSEADLDNIMETGKIDLLVWGHGHPPVALVVWDKNREDEERN